MAGPVWKVPPCTLSSAGRIVVLRSGDAKARLKGKKTVEDRLNEGVVAQIATDEQLREVMPKRAPFWYPTLLLNLDVKKALPDEGVKFLGLRVQTKSIHNGRYDLEVIIWDEHGDLVALSHHVCFVLGSERNVAQRRNAGERL